jgi:hypothetical protein
VPSLANRSFGATIDIPLLFFMHFTGTVDHRDPALSDGFTQDCEVILTNNAGVSSSSDEVPASIEEMAQHAVAFIDSAEHEHKMHGGAWSSLQFSNNGERQ